jgi:hypothetical protein
MTFDTASNANLNKQPGKPDLIKTNAFTYIQCYANDVFKQFPL